MSADLQELQSVAVEAAQAAGEILTNTFGKIREISVKHQAGIVTEADKKAEAVIIKHIQKRYADHAILAEESGEHGASEAEYKWVIDPLDGTTNYAHQLPLFSCSIGIEHKGVPVVGVALDPVHRALYTAQKGKGAFKNGEPIHVSQTKRLSEALLATGFAYQRGEELQKGIDLWAPFMEITRGIRRCGSAVWDLCAVAQGAFDGFWELQLQPWDVAAVFVIITEAGGKITKYDGSPASIYDQEILASNGLVHSQMIDIIQRDHTLLAR